MTRALAAFLFGLIVGAILEAKPQPEESDDYIRPASATWGQGDWLVLKPAGTWVERS